MSAEPGQQAEWIGHPRGGLRFQRGDIFMIPFSLLWGGLVLFSLGPTFTHPAAGNSAIGSIVLCFFAVVAVYIVAGRFLVDMYLRSQTTYQLRGESAIIRRTGLFANTTEVYLPSVGSINLDLSADGSGTIYFGPRSNAWNGTGWPSYGPNSPAFVMIDRAQYVFDRCKALQRR